MTTIVISYNNVTFLVAISQRIKKLKKTSVHSAMACLTDLPPAYCKIIIGRSREFFWQRREIQSVNLVNNNGEAMLLI